MLKLFKGNHTKPLCRFMSSVNHSAPNPIYIKGGTVVNSDYQFKTNVLIKNGKIESLHVNDEKESLPPNTKVIDATGKYVIPGGIDPHTHLEY